MLQHGEGLTRTVALCRLRIVTGVDGSEMGVEDGGGTSLGVEGPFEL